MTLLFNIEIADTCFGIYGSSDLVLRDVDPAYASFLKQGDKENSRPADMKIRLEPDCPDIQGLRQIFDSGQAWSMYDGGGHFFIAHHSPAFDKPFWIVKVDRAFTKATLHMGEAFLEMQHGRQVLRSNPVSYPLDQILLMYMLSRREGALIHAAGIDINGKGCLFPGKSGAGKSTLTRRFAGREGIGLLSDDRIVARKMKDAFKAYGTPWPGEAGIAVNRGVPLSGIFFLNHATDCRIKEINSKQALKNLLPVVSIPWYDRDTMPEILCFCEELVSNVPVYELYFKPDIEVVDVLERFVSA